MSRRKEPDKPGRIQAQTAIQPLMEYQFTGNLWLQENGKEWTILAFMQNEDQGLGLDIRLEE